MVIETAAAIVVPIGNSQHPMNGAHRAADAGTDGAADHATDRTGNPIAFVSALLRTAHDALGVAGVGGRQQRQSDGSSGKDQPRR